MRLLVTGANGFLGQRVLEQLARSEIEVHAVGRTETRNATATWHVADLLQKRHRERLIAEVAPSHLIHLAWTTEHGTFWESADNTDWITATVDLLDHFMRSAGERAVLAGSCAEYDWTHPALRTEGCHELTTPLRPATIYGKAKLETFRQATELGTTMGVTVAWARLFFLFGVEEHPDRLVPTLIRTALRNETPELRHPNRVLDFMSSHQAASALVDVLKSDVTGPINLASGRGVRLGELATVISRIVGGAARTRISPGDDSGDGALRIVADTTRLSTETQFDPKYDLEAALGPIATWWREQAELPNQIQQQRDKRGTSDGH